MIQHLCYSLNCPPIFLNPPLSSRDLPLSSLLHSSSSHLGWNFAGDAVLMSWWTARRVWFLAVLQLHVSTNSLNLFAILLKMYGKRKQLLHHRLNIPRKHDFNVGMPFTSQWWIGGQRPHIVPLCYLATPKMVPVNPGIPQTRKGRRKWGGGLRWESLEEERGGAAADWRNRWWSRLTEESLNACIKLNLTTDNITFQKKSQMIQQAEIPLQKVMG